MLPTLIRGNSGVDIMVELLLVGVLNEVELNVSHMWLFTALEASLPLEE